MTDVQLLIASPFGILAFYLAIRYVYKMADKMPPEKGQKFRKNFRPIIFIYGAAMTIQLIYLIQKIFFD